jgi:polyisoprenoid-binding protein YceI
MSRKWWVIGGGVIVVLVALVGVWFVFLRDDAPAEVDITAANEDLDRQLATTTSGATAVDGDVTTTSVESTAAPAIEGIDGVWVIDDEIGDFDFETASGSFAGFRVAEELTVGETTAVGRSGDVAGSLTIEDGVLTAATVEVDMTTIVSDRSQREGAIRRAIDASTFPTATFVLTDPVDVSALEVGGDPVTVTVEGDLTVSGVTNPTTWEMQANVRDDGFGVVTGSTEIVWEDFGVTPPSAPIVVSVADEGTVEFQLVVTR